MIDTYSWGGQRYTSVTDVLKYSDKDGLVYWAAEQVAKYVFTIVCKIEEKRISGVVGMGMLKDMAALRNAPWDVRNDAKEDGQAIHRCVNLLAQGAGLDPDNLAPAIRPYVRSLNEWWEANEPEVLYTEATVLSHAHEYAGRLDLIISLGGRRLIVDAKKGKASYAEDALQLAAYRFAEALLVPEGSIDDLEAAGLDAIEGVVRRLGHGWEVPMPEVDGCAVLLLQPHEARLLEWECGEDAFSAFLHLMDYALWRKSRPAPREVSPSPTTMTLLEPEQDDPLLQGQQ